MTNETYEERLEQIGYDAIPVHDGMTDELVSFELDPDDYYFLFRQASRVRELEKALQFYVDEKTYQFTVENGRPTYRYKPIDKDNGEMARQALSK